MQRSIALKGKSAVAAQKNMAYDLKKKVKSAQQSAWSVYFMA